MKLVCGIGVNKKQRPGVGTRAYHVWVGILADCSNPETKSKIGDFKNYTKFYDWYESQIGYDMDYRITKDLIDKKNNKFSSDKCVLVPLEISYFLRKSKKSRGKLPVGVDKQTNGNPPRYIARASFGDVRKTLGTRSTPQEAFELYKAAKEAEAHRLAEKYRDQIDPRAYEALLNYKVEITD